MCRILVIGAGGVGIYFSGRLAQAGAEVSVVARGDYEVASHTGYDIHSVAGDFHFMGNTGVSDGGSNPVMASCSLSMTPAL